MSILVAALAAFAPAAQALTECVVSPGELYIGGDPPIVTGNAYFFASWVEGGASVVYQSDVNYKPLLAMVMMAKTTHQKLRIRYQADNVSCTATNPSPLMGITML